jgi:hypothetical protein
VYCAQRFFTFNQAGAERSSAFRPQWNQWRPQSFALRQPISLSKAIGDALH